MMVQMLRIISKKIDGWNSKIYFINEYDVSVKKDKSGEIISRKSSTWSRWKNIMWRSIGPVNALIMQLEKM